MKKIMMIVPMMALVLVGMLSIAASRKPITIYMCGDSTMADREDTTITPERGWGQVFPTFLAEDVTVKNHAKNGRSTKSFLQEERWSVVKNELKRGDIVFIQFGHNDTKQSDPARYTPITDYERNLTQMIKEAKKKHAKVILCTPISRRSFNKHTGELVNKHGGYPEAARRVAEASDVPLLDMTELTMNWLREVGDSASIQYFCHMPAGVYAKYPDGKIDNTHLREAGAVAVARIAAEEIAKQVKTMKFLAPYIEMPKDDKIEYTTPCGIK